MTDQDDENRIGAYAPPSDGYETFDAREEEGRRGTFLLVVVFGVIILFVGVVWSAFNQGVREADSAPRIVADIEPYRARPADPGGEETPDTGLAVYDRLTGDTSSTDDVSLRPAAEEPIDDRPALRVETVGADQTDPEPSASAEATSPDVTPRPAPERPAPQPAETADRQPADSDAAQSSSFERPPVSEPAQPEPAVETAPSGTATPVVTGDWVVQIASFRTEADAEAAWLAFGGRFADIAAGLAPDIATVEIEGRGTYHRLRIAAFGSRDDAVAFCSTLQGRGQDCLVARR